MFSLFVKRRKQKPREVMSLAQSHTAESGSAEAVPRPSGCSGHNPNHPAKYPMILVFWLPSLSPSPGTCLLPSRPMCVSLFSLCRPEFASRLPG